MDIFAKGLGVLQASGLKLGMAKFDLRGYYRALVCNSREFQYGVQVVDPHIKFEDSRMLLFGQVRTRARGHRVGYNGTVSPADTLIACGDLAGDELPDRHASVTVYSGTNRARAGERTTALA